MISFGKDGTGSQWFEKMIEWSRVESKKVENKKIKNSSDDLLVPMEINPIEEDKNG